MLQDLQKEFCLHQNHLPTFCKRQLGCQITSKCDEEKDKITKGVTADKWLLTENIKELAEKIKENTKDWQWVNSVGEQKKWTENEKVVLKKVNWKNNRR